MDCSTPGFPVLHHHLEFAQMLRLMSIESMMPSNCLGTVYETGCGEERQMDEDAVPWSQQQFLGGGCYLLPRPQGAEGMGVPRTQTLPDTAMTFRRGHCQPTFQQRGSREDTLISLCSRLCYPVRSASLRPWRRGSVTTVHEGEPSRAQSKEGGLGGTNECLQHTHRHS